MTHVRSQDGTLIAHEMTGRGPAVILVDGAIGYRAFNGGRPLAAALATDHTVIVYDRRGRGESTDTAPYAVEREIEDIAALIAIAGAPVSLYGFSSGAVLAVKAAARLGAQVAKLAVLEPPFDADDEEARRQFAEQQRQLVQLIDAGKHGDAVAFFLADMVPPDVLANLRRSADWPLMEAVAPTLAYDYQVMGDGTLPAEAARAVHAPALVLAGGDSPPFKLAAAKTLAEAMPHARCEILAGQTTRVPPEVLAPVLRAFFRAPAHSSPVPR